MHCVQMRRGAISRTESPPRLPAGIDRVDVGPLTSGSLMTSGGQRNTTPYTVTANIRGEKLTTLARY